MIRIAVIGGGPKSLFAMLALNDLLPSHGAKQVTLDVFDPLPPGAGSVWRVAQPEVLRLNVAADIVDASSTLSAENFIAWMNRVVPQMSGEKYPPRKLVGRYLHEQFQLLTQQGKAKVSHVPSVVTGVERDGEFWRVCGSHGSKQYDEVLLATGHGLAKEDVQEPLVGALNWCPLIGDYDSVLEPSKIPAGSDVWVRGAALTAYDVALLLSEGRGGSWQWANNDGDGTQPVLQYRASGAEPRRITLFSRSGMLMDPKSETSLSAVTACLDQNRQRLRQWAREARSTQNEGEVTLEGLWAVLLRCAQECAYAMGTTVSPRTLWRTALTGQSIEINGILSEGSGGPDAAARLRNSIAVNNFDAPLTTGWLWARVWSGLYGELIPAIDRLPRGVRESFHFASIARNMERFAFGPPQTTAYKLVALFDAGLLHLAGPGDRPPTGAVLIDAVTPAPGVLRPATPGARASCELFASLLRNGEISVPPGQYGILTEIDGTCVARDGSRNETLSAIGRPTEGPTLGHDTLNRSLHGEHRLWAQRIARLVSY